MRESEIQRQCIEWCRPRGLVCVNVHGGGWGSKGFPDLLVMGKGKVLAVELKNPTSGYRLQPDQQVWRDRLAKAGVPWALATSREEFVNKVREVFYGISA